MDIRARSLFFSYWYLFLFVGGLTGFAFTYLNWPIAWILGALGGWIGAGSLSFLAHSREVKTLRKMAQDPDFPVDWRESWVALEHTDHPLEEALKISHTRGSAAPALSTPRIPDETVPARSVTEEEWQSFTQELEVLVQTIHNFREVIRDWSSNIEKAGRINKSLLQLNELIVNDSKKVALDTDEAARSATEGIKSVGKEIKAMTDLKATIGSSAEVIQQLSLASDQIGDFLATITTIARKTNLLALNAGIEAARAGEHGQGFAVVASEIKTLAEASAKASGDVKTLVDDIRTKTSSAISLISTTGKIEENVNVVYSAGDVFMNIVKSIRKAGGLLGEISQALEDQRNDNELLLQLINRIYLSGDQVRERFSAVEDGLAQIQRSTHQLKVSSRASKISEAS